MPHELSRFERDIIHDHVDADEDGRNFAVHWDIDDPAQNCFAYAVNQPQAIRPMNMPELDEKYNRLGYFRVDAHEPLLAHDVEIYVLNNVPLHAHKVKTPSQGVCESKMGYGPVITHPRGMLQSHVRGRPNVFKFGHIAARYRHDRTKLKEYLEKFYVKTTTNRWVKKKEATRTTSGSVIHIDDAEKTRSGRIIKRKRSASDDHYGNKTAHGTHAAPAHSSHSVGAARPPVAAVHSGGHHSGTGRQPVATHSGAAARPVQTAHRGGHAGTTRPVVASASAGGGHGHGQAQGHSGGGGGGGGGLFGFGKKKRSVLP